MDSNPASWDFGLESPIVSITPNPGSPDTIFTAHISLPVLEEHDPDYFIYQLGVPGGKIIQERIDDPTEGREYRFGFDCSPQGQEVRCNAGGSIGLGVEVHYPSGTTQAVTSARIGYPGPTLSRITPDPAERTDTLSITATSPPYDGHKILNWVWTSDSRGQLRQGNNQFNEDDPLTLTLDCQALSCRNDETITFSATINYQQRQGPRLGAVFGKHKTQGRPPNPLRNNAIPNSAYPWTGKEMPVSLN